MFCDLVGSTALSVQFDAEDLHDIIVDYLTCCKDVVKRFDGHVANFMGDGLLVHFGFPTATEHDAQRAVRAALAIVSAVQGLRPRPKLALQTRIGIATGEVVIGSESRGDLPAPTIVEAISLRQAGFSQGVCEPR
jgi:class 3 adenylate cyclase